MNKQEFLKDLKELLIKHGLNSIGGTYDGDTYGTYDDRFVVYDKATNTEIFIDHGTIIDVYDINQLLD